MAERDQFPRLFELADMNASFGEVLRDADLPGVVPIKQKFLRDFEGDLAGLDDDAWTMFRENATPYLCGGYTQKVKKGKLEGSELPRAWQPLYDLRNEVRAYNYLRSSGCSHVRFIPEGRTETPDLEAMRGNRRVLCEVKTINKSDFAIFQSYDRSFAICLNERQDKFINARSCMNKECTLSNIIDHKFTLPDEFFTKLSVTLCKAKRQLDADKTCGNPVMIAYFFLDFDDCLGEHQKNYEPQLDQFRNQWQKAGIEIVFDYFPPGYWASP